MTRTRIVIVGAGGFGREAADVIDSMNRARDTCMWELVGVFDDSPSEENLGRLRKRGIPYLGPLPSGRVESDTRFVVGIGNPQVRENVTRRLLRQGWNATVLVHPTAGIGTQVEIGNGTVICAGVQISTNVIIGDHAHLNPNSTIGHDVRIENYVSVNPSATVSGDVHIKEKALIGANSIVLQGQTIGSSSIVGAAACVVNDVADGRVVKGVPAA